MCVKLYKRDGGVGACYFIYLQYGLYWFCFTYSSWNVTSMTLKVYLTYPCKINYIFMCWEYLSIFMSAWWKNSKHFKASFSCAEAWYKTNRDFRQSVWLRFIQVSHPKHRAFSVTFVYQFNSSNFALLLVLMLLIGTIRIVLCFSRVPGCILITIFGIIYFRNHIYEKKGGPKSVELKEIGPRFELRLYQVTTMQFD